MKNDVLPEFLEHWSLAKRDGLKWSPWVSLEMAYKQAAPSPGAYVLALPSGRPIPRLLGVDLAGALDIGESGDLQRRLAQLYNSVSTKDAAGHMARMAPGHAGPPRKAPGHAR